MLSRSLKIFQDRVRSAPTKSYMLGCIEMLSRSLKIFQDRVRSVPSKSYKILYVRMH